MRSCFKDGMHVQLMCLWKCNCLWLCTETDNIVAGSLEMGSGVADPIFPNPRGTRSSILSLHHLQITTLCLFKEKPSVLWYMDSGCNEKTELCRRCLPDFPPVRSGDVHFRLVTYTEVLCSRSSVVACREKPDASLHMFMCTKTIL